MRAACILIFVTGVAGFAGDPPAAPLKAVEGECALVAFDGKGLKVNKADLKKLPLARRDATVTADAITAEFAGKRETRTYKVDNTKSPAHIDLTLAAGGKTETSYGIYKVEGGVLTICASEEDKADARPTEFKAGKGVYLMTVRKRGELEGTYAIVGLAAKGLTLGEADLKKVPEAERLLVIDDDELVLMFNGKDERGTFGVDASKTPPHINLGLTRDGKTETSPGIYKYEDGVLTIAAATGTDLAARPTEFKGGDKVTLFTLKKLPRK
jgi:uncharacterized protein (TIGR03067 family)